MTKSQEKRTSEIKLKAFFIIFKRLSFPRNCVRPESAPLKKWHESISKWVYEKSEMIESMLLILPILNFSCNDSCCTLFFKNAVVVFLFVIYVTFYVTSPKCKTLYSPYKAVWRNCELILKICIKNI